MLELDYTPCRLPRLEKSDLIDPNKGLWEFWGQDEGKCKQLGLRARNPALDLREDWVAIDFGTSSTTVAVALPTGAKQLLRVGVQDFYAPITAKQYENPTVLEFINLPALLSVWSQQVYRPALNWNWLRVAHEARNDFRSNTHDPKMLRSVILHLKRWAMEADAENPLILVDQKQQQELRLAPPRTDYPVRGQIMAAAGEEASLDLIELYAWHLGMAINWRQRGIYLKYALTFPVKYPPQVCKQILAAFTRGLQRSLPLPLVQQSALLNEFEVCEVANEPMAYAAAILPHLALTPSPQGLAYAVFDFGGGTTDFDFGLWRQPTPEEADEEGVESVFVRLGSGGDPYLGGENLLALMAYELVQENLQSVYDKRLVFARPLSEPAFPGSEAVLENSGIAQANAAILVQMLRPLLEAPESFETDRVNLDMLDRSGQSVAVTFEIPGDKLQELLRARIYRGVEGFLHELHAAFAQETSTEIHILLAGNASRSEWVREAFDTSGEAWGEWIGNIYGHSSPEFVVHFAEGADGVADGAPNCKTAVALGLLDLVPGSRFLRIDPQEAISPDDAPFHFFVGRLVQNVLQPVLLRGIGQQDWQELGVLREGIFELAWSASPHARNGMARGDSALRLRRIRFPGAGRGYRCFARVVDADTVELRAVLGQEMLQEEKDVPVRVSLKEVAV